MTIHPPDAAVAARSFPRRWRALFARAAGDDDAPDVLQRSGALDLAAKATSVLRAAAEGVGGVRRADRDEAGGLDGLERAALGLAEAIDQVDAERWTPGRVDVMSTGIDEVAGLLRQAEAAIEAARADRGG